MFFVRHLLRVGALFLAGVICVPSAGADTYRVLNDGPEALQARIDLIQQAKTSIDMSYYTWADDATGRQLLGLLREAATERNVLVRIIVDSKHNDIPSAIRLHLASQGITIQDYLPFQLFRLSSWIHSMHNKLLIVDGTTLVMGGRNVDGGYFELPVEQKFHDRDAIIRGQAVTDAQKYFNSLWDSDLVVSTVRNLNGLTPEDGKRLIDESLVALAADPMLRLRTGTDWITGQPERAEVHFLHDEISSVKYEKPIRDQLYRLASSARESIVIEVAYLALTDSLMDLLGQAIDRGVHVRILTNSMRSNDVDGATAAYLARRRKMVRMGIELWEYNSDTTLHVKSAVIDDRYAVIGSYNLDPVSKILNSEMVSYIEDPQVAVEIHAAMDENLKASSQIDRRGFPSGCDRRFPDQPWGKVVKTQFLRYLIWPLLATRLIN